MKLVKGQVKELADRCHTALKRKTFSRQVMAMGNYINIDHKKPPPPLERKWKKAVLSLATKTFTGWRRSPTSRSP
jgi:hypothetical protein